MDDQTEERDSELCAKASMESCSSLVCLSPRASTDALLPSFQPEDDADVKLLQPSASSVVTELPQRKYPGTVPPPPHFAPPRLSRSPRSDDPYPGHAASAPYPAVHSDHGVRGSPRGAGPVVEDLTSPSKADRAFGDSAPSQSVGDGRDAARRNVDLLRVDTSSHGSICRPTSDPAVNRVRHLFIPTWL